MRVRLNLFSDPAVGAEMSPNGACSGDRDGRAAIELDRQIGKTLRGIEAKAVAAMRAYPWPGNVRELQNVIERAVILAQELIRVDNLPGELVHLSAPATQDSRDILKKTELEIIIRALRNHGGNRRLAAAEMGITRRSLQYKLKEYGLLDDQC